MKKIVSKLFCYDCYDCSDQHQALGCLEETLHLSCTNGDLINVTRAYYGQYRQTTPCSGGCCAPNPGEDCTETVIYCLS